MSSSIQVSPSYTQSIFDKALAEYKKKTGNDLITHPLATEIRGCGSPEAILIVLEEKANELNQCRNSDERLIKWLNPTVNILNVLSATLGEGSGSVFPPTKAIFSGLGILLVAAKSTLANRAVLAELFDGIESFFGRLQTYTEVPPTQAVTDVLVKIMADILSILAIATKGVKQRRTKIFLKKLAGMNDIEDALQRLRKLEQGELLAVIAQMTRDEQETQRIVKEILNKMDARSWEEVPQKLKGWLSPPDPSTNYNIGLRDLHKETATWFIEGRIFQGWHSSGSLLWIHGKPGSGKSILCSAIIIQRILSLSDGGRASVAYFYFDFRDDNKKHLHDLLLSLLAQFTANSIPCCDMISRVYSSHGKGTQRPSDDVLITCLTNMLTATTLRPTYIIVDALDECPNTSGVRSPRERVLSFIKHLVDLRLPNLHICITSRPEIDIRTRLEPLTSLRVSLHDQTKHREDITKYIRSEVGFIANANKWRENEMELVIETLSEKADGMFRWVFCQLETLRLCLRSNVRHILKEQPDSLDETYERVLKDIHKTNRGHVQRLLQCLAVAIRPLRVDELAGILTFNFDAIDRELPTFDGGLRSEDREQELLSACPSLITISGSHDSRVVQFSHFSVKEFLTSDRLSASSEDISRYHILPDAAHTTLARASLGVLLRLDGRVNVRVIPLVEYAANYWVSHAQVGSVSLRVMGLMETLFDSDKPHLAMWVQLHDIDRPPLPKWRLEKAFRNPLYYSALCGFPDLVEHLVKKHPQHINAIGGEHDYPLAAALYGGHIQVAELLYQHGANVDAHGREEQTPLHRAFEWPNNLADCAVSFLLEHGAEVNARRKDLSTPLHLAATLGDLEQTADADSRNVSRETSLRLVRKRTSSTTGGNRANLVRLLLKYGADVDSRDEKDATTLHYASLVRDLRVVQVLLDHGANVNAEDNWRLTPLHRVLEDNHNSDKDRFIVAQLLVERGADVNARHKDGETPLHLASYLLEVKLVRMFHDHGANVNVKDNWGRTPLHRVLEAKDYCDDDRFSVAQLLIERGADVNSRDEDPKTPLHLASYFPDLSLVRMLLDHGAIVNAEDGWGRTPLHRVLEAQDYSVTDRFGVAQLLMERGADVNARDEDHETPLHFASRFLEAKLVRMLLDHGANVNAEDNQTRTPLHRVPGARGYSDDDRFRVAQLLVERGADVNAGHKNYETPLHLAARFLQVKLLRMFLDHGANVNVKDNLGRTPLHRVLEDSHNSDEDRFGVAQLLVERGADVNTADNTNETPFHLATRISSLKVAWVLLKHGAGLKVENKKGKVPSQLRVVREESGKR